MSRRLICARRRLGATRPRGHVPQTSACRMPSHPVNEVCDCSPSRVLGNRASNQRSVLPLGADRSLLDRGIFPVVEDRIDCFLDGEIGGINP